MVASVLRCSTIRSTFRFQYRHSLRCRFFTSNLPLHEPSSSLLREAQARLTLKPLKQVNHAESESSFHSKVGRPGVRRQIAVRKYKFHSRRHLCLLEQFVVITSFLAFVYAGTETHLETQHWKEKMTTLSSVWSVKTITNTDLKRAQNAELIQVCSVSDPKIIFDVDKL